MHAYAELRAFGRGLSWGLFSGFSFGGLREEKLLRNSSASFSGAAGGSRCSSPNLRRRAECLLRCTRRPYSCNVQAVMLVGIE